MPRPSNSPTDVAVILVLIVASVLAAPYVFFRSTFLFSAMVQDCVGACGSSGLLLGAYAVVWGGLALAFIVGSIGVIIAGCTRRTMWPSALAALALITRSLLTDLGFELFRQAG